MMYLRIAQPDDIDVLYKWANDPVVRKNSFATHQITYSEHKSWFAKVLTTDRIVQYILMDNDQCVGQVRITIDNEEAEIGYSIDESFRGRGCGNTIIALAMNVIEKDFPKIKKIVAKVKPDNIASKKIFENAGFSCSYICFEKQPNR